MFMSIGAAASYLGVSVVTLRRGDRSGVLKPAWKTVGGHRRYDLAELSRGDEGGKDLPGKTVVYARVSSHDQREDLERQAQRLKSHCEEKGWSNPEIIQALGSGLNYKKRGLSRLLKLIYRREISCLVIQCKDRLLRFGAEIIFSLCKAFGIRVEIVEPPDDSFEDRLAADVIEIMTVFSARLYGRRAHRNKKNCSVISTC